jgi:hypothetical protein
VGGLLVGLLVSLPACIVSLGSPGGSIQYEDAGGGGDDSTAPDSTASDGPTAGDSGTATDGAGMDTGTTDSGGADSAHRDGAGDSSASMDSAIDSASDTGAADGPADSPPETTALAYCASLSTTPLFCDDFDQGALATPWDQVLSGGGGDSIDATYSVSAPDAMLASVTAGTAASSVDLGAYKSFPSEQGVAGTYTLSFDVRIDAADESASSDGVLAAIQLWNGSATWDMELEVAYSSSGHDFTATLTENSSTDYAAHAASQTLPKGAWTRVDIGITLPANAGGRAPATMSFGGTQVVATNVHVTTSNPIPEIIVGPTYATPTAGGWTVRYDNVTFK